MLKTVRVPEKFAPLFEEAQAYVARYFADQKSTPEHGTLEICGQRYVLVRAGSMSVEFHDVVRAFYGEAAEALSVAHSLLFDIAHAMGLADANAFAERMNLTDPMARLSAGPIHFAHAGWSFVDISPESTPTPDENFYILYDHPYSFESDSWLLAKRHSERPVCAMNAGYSSGWCEKSFGLPLAAVEILCRARGDDVCRFIMAPPDRIESRINDYVEQNPELLHVVSYQVPGFLASRTDRQLLRRNLELEQRAEISARELFEINEQLRQDIVERKRTERLLSASKELTDRLIEALPGGVVQVSKDGAVVRANVEACRILGLGYDELTRRFIADFETETIFENGAHASVAEYPVSRALATGAPQPAMTLGVRKPNAEVSWAVFRAVPTRDSTTHEIDGAVVTFLDITERKRFEDKLRHTQKLESLGVLAGGIAHDFNNLLVTILGNASFAKSVTGADPRITPLLEEIELGANRAAELTKQMLEYAGQGKFRVQRLELAAVVREMAKLLKALIPKHVEIHYRFQEGLPPIEADAAQIRQVVMNLITNAAEALEDHTGRVVISLDEHYASERELEDYMGDPSGPGQFLCLEISDTGSGMDAATKSRIFDPFFTTKFKGRGLGMAAVLGIIRGHRAGIRIESRQGAGTTVSVLFPTKVYDTSRQGPELPNSGTILVVDDDIGVQAVTRRALSSNGYRVVVASNGAEGVRLFEQLRQDICLILMDMTMPELNGFEALKLIRASGSLVPVVLSSGYDVDPARVEVRAFSGILEKPYDVATLLAAVERALQKPESS